MIAGIVGTFKARQPFQLGREERRSGRPRSTYPGGIQRAVHSAVRQVPKEEVIVPLFQINGEIHQVYGIQQRLCQSHGVDIRGDAARRIQSDAESDYTAQARGRRREYFGGLRAYRDIQRACRQRQVDVITLLIQFHSKVQVGQSFVQVQRQTHIGYVRQSHVGTVLFGQSVAHQRSYDGHIRIEYQFVIGQQYL